MAQSLNININISNKRSQTHNSLININKATPFDTKRMNKNEWRKFFEENNIQKSKWSQFWNGSKTSVYNPQNQKWKSKDKCKIPKKNKQWTIVSLNQN